MRLMRSSIVWILALAVLAAPALAQAPDEPAEAKPKPAAKPTQLKPPALVADEPLDRAAAPRKRPAPLPARFQATVFQVEIPADQLTALDARSLATKAKTAVALEASLKGLGATKSLYRVDQSVDLRAGARFEVSANVPFVTHVAEQPSGKKAYSIARETLGATFAVRSALDPEADASGLLAVSVAVEISALEEGEPLDGDTRPTIRRKIEQSNGGAVTLGKPMVLITADNADGKTIATAFITHVEFSAE